MNAIIKIQFSIILLLFLPIFALAQDNVKTHNITIGINEIALIGLNDDSPMVFNITAPTDAGDVPVINPDINAERKLFYTSIISSLSLSRRVTAKLDDDLPDGFKISLFAFSPVNGVGLCGTTRGLIDLTTTAKDILGGIKSGWTGTLFGSSLVYFPSFDALKAGQLYFQSKTVKITYTLTDN